MRRSGRCAAGTASVAAVLLPPSLVTGLLGINVGGVPGSDSPQGCLVVIVLIGLVAVVEVVILHRLKWI